MPWNYETTHVRNRKVGNLATRPTTLALPQGESLGEKALKQTAKCRCCWLSVHLAEQMAQKLCFPTTHRQSVL
jgi:hypothetical protein